MLVPVVDGGFSGPDGFGHWQRWISCSGRDAGSRERRMDRSRPSYRNTGGHEDDRMKMRVRIVACASATPAIAYLLGLSSIAAGSNSQDESLLKLGCRLEAQPGLEPGYETVPRPCVAIPPPGR